MKLRLTSAIVLVLGFTASAQQPARSASQATFTKDVAPILQRACQNCHRPGQMAPMSLMTYQDVRPWARSIKQRVVERAMPPWGIDPHVGIQSFKNDPSLRQDEIDTIAAWADAGAPQGNAADMPKPREFDDASKWHIGTPDLIVTSPKHTVPAEASDWWGSYVVDAKLTEDRYIKAIETKAGKTDVVHHLLTYAVEGDDNADSNGDDSSAEAGDFLNEFAVGKNGDLFPEGTGRLLKAGSKIKFDFHYHSVGKETVDQSQLGIVLYPKGYTPKHRTVLTNMGASRGRGIDIAPNTIAATQGFTVLSRGPARLENFQPHMHLRGKAMALEAILPNGTRQMINFVNNFQFNWMNSYEYTDDAAPIFPKGTIISVTAWHDNTVGNKNNPDPTQWVGGGDRSVDEMAHAWVNVTYLTEEEYKAEVAKRRAAQPRNTQQQQ